MPLCICKEMPLPSFDDREPIRGRTPEIQGEYIIHQECHRCSGFRIFTWGKDGKKLEHKTHAEYLEFAKAFNERRKKRDDLSNLW